jgi:hypothetical protein
MWTLTDWVSGRMWVHFFFPLALDWGFPGLQQKKDTYRQPESWYALSGILARNSGVVVEIVVGVLEKLTFGP